MPGCRVDDLTPVAENSATASNVIVSKPARTTIDLARAAIDLNLLRFFRRVHPA